MSLTVTQTATAISPSLTASFDASGGTPPYTFTVSQVPAGPGGTIAQTGIYTAPAQVTPLPVTSKDTIVVTDALGATGSAKILVGTIIQLFCELIQVGMALPDGRVYVWNQKVLQPKDEDLYVIVSASNIKPFGNTKTYSGVQGLNSIQSVNIVATLDVNIISRGPAARDLKEFVLMSIYSDYSEQQQAANSFSIGRLPAGSRFMDLSSIDGAAIGYRYMIPINITYFVSATSAVNYFSTFSQKVFQKES